MYRPCAREGLLAALDRAWPGDDRQLGVADRSVAGTDNRFVGSQIQRNQFVRLCYANHFRHTGKDFETPTIDWDFIDSNADRRPRCSWHGVRAEADRLNNC